MKQLKTILKEVKNLSDEFEALADAERTGEISRKTYYRACAELDMSSSEAKQSLYENYQRAGIKHLF